MENEESKRLRLSEEIYLESNLKQCSLDNGYVFGVYDGDMEQLINRYVAVNSSCFVKSAVHHKEKGHKRYSNTGKNKEENSVIVYAL